MFCILFCNFNLFFMTLKFVPKQKFTYIIKLEMYMINSKQITKQVEPIEMLYTCIILNGKVQIKVQILNS